MPLERFVLALKYDHRSSVTHDQEIYKFKSHCLWGVAALSKTLSLLLNTDQQPGKHSYMTKKCRLGRKASTHTIRYEDNTSCIILRYRACVLFLYGFYQNCERWFMNKYPTES